MNMITCTGCGLLCDDIEISGDEIRNACILGVSKIKGCKNRLEPTKDYIKKAAEILKNSSSPMIFGLDNSSCEAQIKAIQLAKKLNARIDDTSSFCQGIFIEKILQKKFKTCSLEEIRDNADVLIYWGSDAQESHPRHLSKYTYFPRGKLRQRGYEEDRTCAVIDIRCSSTAKICKANFYKIKPKEDKELILSLIDALSGKVPKYKTKQTLKLANIIKKAEFGVVFIGLGLTYSIKDDIELFIKLTDMLPNFRVMVMVGHYNMRGFNENLYKETGFVNSVKFENNKAIHDKKYSIVSSILSKEIDALVVIGSDIISCLPYSVVKNIDIPIICIDPCITYTSKIAKVNIPCRVSGVETDGTCVRMDGAKINLVKFKDSDFMSDKEILERIIEEL